MHLVGEAAKETIGLIWQDRPGLDLILFGVILILVLAYLPEVAKGEETTISGRVLALFYTLLMVAISIPMYRFMMTNSP